MKQHCGEKFRQNGLKWIHCFAGLSVLTLTSVARAQADPAPAGLVSRWPGENSSADTVGGNNGTNAGTGTVTYGPGVVGKAFVFDGTHRDRIDLGNPASLQLQDFTLEAWIKRSSPTVTAFDILGADGSVSGDGACILGYGRGGYILAVANDGRLILSRTDIDGLFSAPLITDLNWHHLAVTKAGSNVVFYVDGMGRAMPPYVPHQPYTFDNATCSCDAAIAIGSRGDARGGTFYGMIDEPAVFNRALSAGEIQSIYAAGVPPINNWTNPVSAPWQSSSWSLGILPAANQTVNITNAGYKAVGIDSETVSRFPNSLTVSNLAVSAPTNALSTLLLNYAGTAASLKVLNACVIGTNGTLDNFESSLEVDCTNGGKLVLDGGTFFQEGGLTLVNGPVSVIGNGTLNASNANLTLGEVSIGSAPASSGSFIQNGGSILAQHINVSGFRQDPFAPGGYELVSGVLYAIEGTQCSTTGPGFRQFGGTNYGNIIATDGYYGLYSGMAQGNVLTAGSADGNATLFDQEGGLLDMQYINVTAGSNWPPQLGPVFAGGTVHCGTLNIGGNARVELRGADVFVTNNFDLHGMEFNVGDVGPLIERVACELGSGHLYLPSMSLGQYAFFDETGGSNEISGGLSLFGGQYDLFGGTLETTYTGVGLAATFSHAGGQHFVHGVLSVSGTYGLNGAAPGGGCNLVCEGLYLRGALTMTMYFNGRYYDPAATFTNTGVLDLGGTISTELPDAQAGQVELATNATIAFSPFFPAVLRFDNSSALSWTAGALLSVTNWSSSMHLYVGNDASGLTASQLQQVQFANPAGFAPGTYPAQILSTGEVVPAPGPGLTAARMPGALVLSWSGNYRLLSATNLAGPYVPLSGASSPWTISFSQPHQFFVLSPP